MKYLWSSLLWIVTAVLFIGLWASSGNKDYGYVSNKIAPDWLNPHDPGLPEWDPYGPEAIPVIGYNSVPGFSGSIQLQSADPSKEGLIIRDKIWSANQLYLQSGRDLVARGSVDLTRPFILWAYIETYGGFALYDYDRLILFQSYLVPGWYRLAGPSLNVLEPHLFRFEAGGILSDNLSILVNPGGYPTTYSLTGRVVDQSGSGMAGVKVIISSMEGGVFSTKTKAFGYYGMDVPAGAFFINAQLPGYSFSQSSARVWSGVVTAADVIIGYQWQR